MNKEALIYLACPYSHADEAVRRDRFEKVSCIAGLLIKAGFMVYSPISMGVPIAEHSGIGGDYKTWEKHCLGMIDKCEYMIVLRLPGHNESVGLNAEAEYAFDDYKPVVGYDYEDLIKAKDLAAYIAEDIDREIYRQDMSYLRIHGRERVK